MNEEKVFCARGRRQKSREAGTAHSIGRSTPNWSRAPRVVLRSVPQGTRAGEESPGVDPVRATVSQPLSSPWEGHPGVALNCQILMNCYGKWKPQTVTKPEARPKDKNPLSGTKGMITEALRLKSKPYLFCMWRAVLCGLFPRQLIGSCHHREPSFFNCRK